MYATFMWKTISISFLLQRRIRAILAEKDLASWGRAETAIKLIDMEFSLEDSVEAAKNCGDLKRCLRYLKQECPLCTEEFPMSQVCFFFIMGGGGGWDPINSGQVCAAHGLKP